MGSLNKVQIIGNLGKDPEMRFTGSGKGVCKFSVAANETWHDAQGQKQEHTEWFNVIVWGKIGESCAKYLAKGRQVYVEGQLRTRTYDDREGTKRWISEVIAYRVVFLGGAEGGESRRADDEPPMAPRTDSGAYPSDDDEIPFAVPWDISLHRRFRI